VWFDDSNAQQKLVRFFDKLEDEDNQEDENNKKRPPQRIKLERGKTSFLDLGCGNGSLLFSLREDGWEGPMLGVDYSEQSIELARVVASSRFEGEPIDNVRFVAWDVLRGDCNIVLGEGGRKEGWDVVLDKGTFDAICLSDERDQDGNRVCEGY
jgi:SAM-dependent methyltransferase